VPRSGAPRPSGEAPLRLSALERRAAASLAGIFGLRLFGLFIVLPVLSVFAGGLAGGENKTLVGIAFGAYGLTQALLQIPFGWLSDRYGRKPILYWGLVVFALGSFLAAASADIYTMIAGRILQGAGAISAVAIAMLADLTRLEVRTRAMALVGISIGLTFMLSLVAGPLLTGMVGVKGLFALTGALAVGAMAIVRWLVPDHAPTGAHPGVERSALGRVLSDPGLLRLNYGIFALHAVLVMLFLEVPHALETKGVPLVSHWTVYLPVMALSVVLMAPAMMRADRPHLAKRIFTGAVAVLLAGNVLLQVFADSLPGLVVALVVFFTAFNLLEAKLPSLVSKLAPADVKGTAIGVYGSVQFLGVFAGGLAGGLLQQHFGAGSVFWCGIALTAAWLVLAMATPGLAPYNYSLAKTE
jgi:MFS family permease